MSKQQPPSAHSNPLKKYVTCWYSYVICCGNTVMNLSHLKTWYQTKLETGHSKNKWLLSSGNLTTSVRNKKQATESIAIKGEMKLTSTVEHPFQCTSTMPTEENNDQSPMKMTQREGKKNSSSANGSSQCWCTESVKWCWVHQNPLN